MYLNKADATLTYLLNVRWASLLAHFEALEQSRSSRPFTESGDDYILLPLSNCNPPGQYAGWVRRDNGEIACRIFLNLFEIWNLEISLHHQSNQWLNCMVHGMHACVSWNLLFRTWSRCTNVLKIGVLTSCGSVSRALPCLGQTILLTLAGFATNLAWAIRIDVQQHWGASSNKSYCQLELHRIWLCSILHFSWRL